MSTALFLGDHPQIPLTLMSAGMMSSLLASGVMNGLSPYYYASIMPVAAHLMWQVWSADYKNSAELMKRFKSNNLVGAFVTAAILAGHVPM